jgi:Mrp family chromosome partitioning ATPase
MGGGGAQPDTSTGASPMSVPLSLDAGSEISAGADRIVLRGHYRPEGQASPVAGVDLAFLVGKLRAGRNTATPMFLNVVSCGRGEGASAVARQIVHSAAQMSWPRILLLDCDCEAGEKKAALGGALPDLVEGYLADKVLSVSEIEAPVGRFHASALRPNAVAADFALSSSLCRLMASCFDLIVVDCPPLFEQSFLIPGVTTPPMVLLVIRAKRTRISVALRAQRDLRAAGIDLWGAVMTGGNSE